MKRKLKYENLSPQLARALEIDNQATGYDDAVETTGEEVPAPQIEEPKRKSEAKAAEPQREGPPEESNALLDKLIAEKDPTNAKP